MDGRLQRPERQATVWSVFKRNLGLPTTDDQSTPSDKLPLRQVDSLKAGGASE
ncbi:hypothetical protein BaRGS_00015872, partial [Batillaria attramentaria]